MGRKRSGARQLVYFLSAGLILSILLGCLPEMRRVATQKEPAIPNLQEEQSAGDNPWEALQRARGMFRQGDFEASFKENQKALEWAGENFPADRALFNMGVIYAYGANPKKDPGKSLGYFRRVAEEFPESPLAEESQAWIGLLQKNLNLANDLVDLTQENVSLIQENASLNQENARLSQMAERHRLQEETVLSARDPFQRAKKFFDQGNFEAALEENQKVLSASGKNNPKDRALFQIGLIYASSRNPKRDLDKSLSFFLRLVKEYPQSPFTDEAKTWVDLLQENHKLNRMIEKSKEVDIAIEEKKREKGR
jgi:tetratricopeptide (TPR) repeat protein